MEKTKSGKWHTNERQEQLKKEPVVLICNRDNILDVVGMMLRENTRSRRSDGVKSFGLAVKAATVEIQRAAAENDDYARFTKREMAEIIEMFIDYIKDRPSARQEVNHSHDQWCLVDETSPVYPDPDPEEKPQLTQDQIGMLLKAAYG